MALSDRAVVKEDRVENVAAMLEALAEELPAHPGRDRDELRDSLSSASPYMELRSVVQLSRRNPAAWAHLQRFIARQSRFVADRVRGIGPDDSPRKAFGKIMQTTGGAASLAMLARELNPGLLQKRLDKLASRDENGRLESDDESDVRERTGTRWVPVLG